MARTCAAAPWSSSLPRPRETDVDVKTGTAIDVVAADSAADQEARDHSTATSVASVAILRAIAVHDAVQAAVRSVTGAETAIAVETVTVAVSAIVAVTAVAVTEETVTVTVKGKCIPFLTHSILPPSCTGTLTILDLFRLQTSLT